MQRLFTQIAAVVSFASSGIVSAPSLSGHVDPAMNKDKAGETFVLPRFTVLGEFLTITFSRTMGGSLTGGEMTWVAKDSPADHRGIQVNDELVSINEEAIAGKRRLDSLSLVTSPSGGRAPPYRGERRTAVDRASSVGIYGDFALVSSWRRSDLAARSLVCGVVRAPNLD
jgi:hypothetical protein